MIRLPKTILLSAAALGLLLAVLNLWLQRNLSLEGSNTSLGVGPNGYKAAFDLLQELEFPVTRSFIVMDRVPHDRTLWFVLPEFLSQPADETQFDVDGLLKWLKAGGTAVVMGGSESDWQRLKVDEAIATNGDSATIQGEYAAKPRTISVTGLAHFKHAAPGAHVRLTASGAPFALDLKTGLGRLVAVADGRFLLNSNLARRDSSVLLVDLVKALGNPTFDEHNHGLAATTSVTALVFHPRLVVALLFILMTAILWIIEQRSWPLRALADGDAPGPSLESFVDSLAALYWRANDPGAAFRAFRSNFLRRARHRFSAGDGLSEQAVIERLLRDDSLASESRYWLTSTEIPATEEHLIRAVSALECGASRVHERR